LIFLWSNIMKSSKGCLSVGLAIALIMCAVATTFGTQIQSTTVKQDSMTESAGRTTQSTAHTKRQRIAARGRRQRYSSLTLKTSVKKSKRVPNAKSLSKESY
jgi:phosphoribosylformylglycinamidine (FGAM) synthase-like enzyme